MSSVKDYYMTTEKIDYVNYYDHVKGNESILIRIRERVLRQFIRQYGSCPFLDVGCGVGLNLRYLPEGSVGLDISPWNVTQAKQYAGTAHLIVGDADHLPLRSHQFGTAICSEVLEHLEHPSRAIAEIHRCLKKKGILIGSVPRPSWIWDLNNSIRKKLANKFLRSALSRLLVLGSPQFFSVPFHILYTNNRLHKLLHRLTVLRVQSDYLGLWWFFTCQNTS